LEGYQLDQIGSATFIPHSPDPKSVHYPPPLDAARESCMMRMRRALEEMVIQGVKTNIPLHQDLLRDPDVINGDYTIKWLEEWLAAQEVS
jgi:biotin carboxylase